MTTIETTTVETPVLTKAERAQAIYAEELAREGVETTHRSRVLDRFEKELGLNKKGGGSTYYQNCKTRAAGEKVKNYYTPASERKAKAEGQQEDDSKEDAQLFSVELTNGKSKSFMSQEALDEFVKDNADIIKAA